MMGLELCSLVANEVSGATDGWVHTYPPPGSRSYTRHVRTDTRVALLSAAVRLDPVVDSLITWGHIK